jgi:hypothetical protein
MVHRAFRFFVLLGLLAVFASAPVMSQEAASPSLLTDPFLQLPTEDTVRVVWFTEWEGSRHIVTYGAALDQSVEAETMKMSRLAEDEASRVGQQTENGQVYRSWTPRDIWRHEAIVTGLTQGERTPYFVTSITDDGTEVRSAEFTLAPLPAPGQPLRILLTSDHQLMPNTPANLQAVVETMGVGTIDAVFLAGDLQNIPDRASEWFDDNRGRAFFPGLQGRAAATVEKTLEENGIRSVTTTTYTGGPIIQYAPLFPATGNHEVMGRFNRGTSTSAQYNDPQPRHVAEARYERLADLINPTNDPAIREQWIIDNSWNTITYEELFSLPDDSPGRETYYAIQFGDVYLISLFSTRIWRTPGLGPNDRGKYREPEQYLTNPDMWGYGDFIFEDLAEGSPQYNWLVEQLNSDAFKNAPIKIVMMHQGPHGVGDNYNPPMAHPVQIIDRDEAGNIIAVRYEYPLEDDITFRDIFPLLEAAGVNLVQQGHSHVWFRMQTDSGMNIIESSNVGNNYGCYLEGYRERGNVPRDPRFNASNYAAFGDPHGLYEPIMPSIFSPQSDDNGNPLPCVNSNDLSIFSVLFTDEGVIRSYVYDMRRPGTEAVLFDEFSILN